VYSHYKMGILHLKMGIQSLKMGIQYLNNIRYIISFLRSTKNIIQSSLSRFQNVDLNNKELYDRNKNQLSSLQLQQQLLETQNKKLYQIHLAWKYSVLIHLQSYAVYILFNHCYTLNWFTECLLIVEKRPEKNKLVFIIIKIKITLKTYSDWSSVFVLCFYDFVFPF
jgi:hypothetical protein